MKGSICQVDEHIASVNENRLKERRSMRASIFALLPNGWMPHSHSSQFDHRDCDLISESIVH